MIKSKEKAIRHYLNFGEKEYTYKQSCKKCEEAIDITLKERDKEVKEAIDKLIVHRDNERKNNNIFRQTTDVLNEDFVDNLEEMKKELGL